MSMCRAGLEKGVRKCSSFILSQVADQFSQHHLLNRLSFLHCIFLPPYRFLRRQVIWSGIPIFLILFHNLLWSPQSKTLTQSIKQMFFWNFLAFSMIQQMLAIWSLVPLPYLNPAWTSGISWFTYCWSRAWRILSIILLACEMSLIVW